MKVKHYADDINNYFDCTGYSGGFHYIYLFQDEECQTGTRQCRIKTLGPKNFKPIIRRGITLVDFWAPWCAPCKVAAPILNDLAESDDRFTVAKVNVEKQQQLAQKYKIRSIPTLILFHDGIEVRRYVGVKTKKFLLREIDSLAG